MNSQTIGDYLIKRTIGRGTFSKVKLAINKTTNQKVAIKILEKSKIVESDDLERIIREMEIIIEFNHPNVIRVHEIFETEDNYLIIMDYCSGGELFNYIVQCQNLEEDEASLFYYQLINGIEYVHSKNIVHRDLKPENLLIDNNGLLKIIDFGLSNYFNGEYLSTPCGSPCYASPEMVGGNEYDGFGIDIWSTGIILFAMICGYLPFEDSDNEKLFKKILKCKVFFPAHVSLEARDLMKKILVTDPKKRITLKLIKEHKFYLKGKEEYEKRFGSNVNLSELDIDNDGESKTQRIDRSKELNEYNNTNAKTDRNIIKENIMFNDINNNNEDINDLIDNDIYYKPSVTESESRNYNNNKNKTPQSNGRNKNHNNNNNNLFLQISTNSNNTINTKPTHITSRTNIDSDKKPLFTDYTTKITKNNRIPKLNLIGINNNNYSKPTHINTLTTPTSVLRRQQIFPNTVVHKPIQGKIRKKTSSVANPNNQLFGFQKGKRNLLFHPNKIVYHPTQPQQPHTTMNKKYIQLTLNSIEQKSKRNNVMKGMNGGYYQYNTVNSNNSGYKKKLPSIKVSPNQRRQLMLFKPNLLKNYNKVNNYNPVKINLDIERWMRIGMKKPKGLRIKDIISLIRK